MPQHDVSKVRYRSHTWLQRAYSVNALFLRALPCALDLGVTTRTTMPIPAPKKQSPPRARPATRGAAQPARLEVRRNQLLAALPDAEMARWLPELTFVDLPLGLVLYELSLIHI